MLKKTGRILLRAASVMLLFAWTAVAALPAAASDAYVYSYEGEYKKTLPLYLVDRLVNLSENLEKPLSKPADFVFGTDGSLYVADTGNNRVLVYDSDFRFKGEITGFVDEQGQQSFSAPEGVFADSNNLLYVADTENGRIAVLNPDGTLNRLIGYPEGTGITESFVYKPTAVAATPDGRVYAVSKSSNMGILSFGADVKFEGFLGVQPVTFSAADMFWRTFMTREQRNRTRRNIPVDFNDIVPDEEGFLFAVSASIDKSAQYSALINKVTAGDHAPIKRLNPSGDDILRRNGFYPPAGDIDIDTTLKIDLAASAFTDVAVTRGGIYSVADATNQRIFTYTPDGNLLSVMGGKGSSRGKFMSVSAIDYRNGLPVVLDAETSALTLYKMSEFGTLVYEALSLQNERKYDEALKKWEEVITLNGNLDMVYLDLGKAYLRAGEYDKAMEAFELIGEKTYYSKAFAEKRNRYIARLLVLVPLFVILVSVGYSKLFARLAAANRADDLNPPAKAGVKKQLQYAVYPIFHPFDGFYNLKRHKRGGTAGALIILAAATAGALISQYLSGYLFSDRVTAQTNFLVDILSFLSPFVLFAIANYCVTSLFDGEGTFRDIFHTVCYSLLPLVLILPLSAIVANVLSFEESVIVTLLRLAAYAWSLLLIFCGMLSIHQYSFSKNAFVCLASLAGILIIAFLGMLFVSLTQKFLVFLKNIVTELSFRL